MGKFKLAKFHYYNNFYGFFPGHTVDDVLFRTHVPKQFSAPNLPELNRSQVHVSFFNFIYSGAQNKRDDCCL